MQTAELKGFYPGTAWAAHGNYGVEYDLTLPLQNTGSAAVTLQLSLDSPLKGNSTTSLLRFRDDLNGPVMFRGPVQTKGLEDSEGVAKGRRPSTWCCARGSRGRPLDS